MDLSAPGGCGRAASICGLRRAALLVATLGVACQDYPFETRLDQKTEAVRVTEVVKTVAPADILFLTDNSGSMVDELTELRNNIRTFVDALSQSQNNYRLGFVAPDVVCNVPERDCSGTGDTARACCTRTKCPGSSCKPRCVDDPDSGFSECDGGRLRAFNGRNRIFERPPEDADAREQWLQDIDDTIVGLGCEGSGYEAGLEVIRRAVVCSLSAEQRVARGLRVLDTDGVTVLSDACPDPNVEKLNAGFLRDDAALIIIFVTDEDDCSFKNPIHYGAPTDNFNAAEQALKLCTPVACYAYHDADADGSGLLDWIEIGDVDRHLDCGGAPRLADPPLPDAVAGFLDDIVAAKTLPGETAADGLARVRAAAVLGGVPGGGGATGFLGRACYFDPNLNAGTVATPGGPSAACGCWGNGGKEYCEVTAMLGQPDTDSPPGDSSRYGVCGTPPPTCGDLFCDIFAGETNLTCPTDCGTPGGCQAMMGGRYIDFIEDLAARRSAVGLDPQVVVDSICQRSYSATFDRIVGLVSTGSCFSLGVADVDPARVQILRNGILLKKVDSKSNNEGWDHDPADPSSVCLVNLKDLQVDDRLEFFLVTSTTTAQ